jgi:hypothetical protein
MPTLEFALAIATSKCLVEKCLNKILLTAMKNEDVAFLSKVDQAEIFFDVMTEKGFISDNDFDSQLIYDISEAIKEMKTRVISESRTARLWNLFLEMMEIARHLIRSDQMGSWELHLKAIGECLPIFAAASHNNYLKTAYHYLQNMHQLAATHPDVHNKFLQDYHVIRRSENYWSGISSDLAIEQSLMRSLKSRGGLTHGSRMTEEMTTQWTLSAPILSEYADAMQSFGGVSFVSSEQHREISSVSRDHEDSDRLVFITSSDPVSILW